MASSQKDMEPQGRGSGSPLHARRPSGSLGLRKTTLESRVHVQTLGLNAEKIFRHRAEGEIFLLTFPFIGPLHLRGRLISYSSKRPQNKRKTTHRDRPWNHGKRDCVFWRPVHL